MHKKLGWLFAYIAVINHVMMFYVLFVIGMLPMGPIIDMTNKVSFFVMLVLIPLGIRFAQQHQYERHRLCMIWTAAFFLVNPSMRFFWMIGGRMYSAEAFGSVGGYFSYLTTAELLAIGLNLSVAIVYTFAGGKKGDKIKSG